jgi:hypothetical protein
MATSSTTFGKTNQPANKPGRGKSLLTKLTDVIRENALLELPEGSTKEEAEKAFLLHTANRAFNPDDQSSATLLKSFLDKAYPQLKAALPVIEFEIGEGSTPLEKANAIFDAIAKGRIPPDVGHLLIQSATSIIKFEEATELKDRIEKLEKMLDEQFS